MTTTAPTTAGPRIRRAGRLIRTALDGVASFVLPPGGALARTLAGHPPEGPSAGPPPMRIHLNAPMLDVRPIGRWMP